MGERRSRKSSHASCVYRVFSASTKAPALVAAQDSAAVQDTQTVEDTVAAPLTPLAQLAADLAAIESRIDEVEANLAAAPIESRAVFTFQRRRRWNEHHQVLGRLVEGIETAGPCAEKCFFHGEGEPG